MKSSQAAQPSGSLINGRKDSPELPGKGSGLRAAMKDGEGCFHIKCPDLQIREHGARKVGRGSKDYGEEPGPRPCPYYCDNRALQSEHWTACGAAVIIPFILFPRLYNGDGNNEPPYDSEN